ncbi:MAG: sacsin N-terminal ATP-binding-like domain-containing protein [Eubacteriales bacterium]
MASKSGIGRERGKLLAEVKRLPPGPQALKKLAFVRKEYDWAIEDYRNTLNILSDTTYQDRKHFLLELIQNADDAQFTSGEAELTFIIGEDSLELRYNEQGFTVEDVIAITGAGVSTKTEKKRLVHSFIGEKGIGFKSVFALASSVEIESPPWHFILKKDKCIVPEVLNSGILDRGEGTRLRVEFSGPEIIEAVSSELSRYVCGQVESFLFLQRLSSFKVADNRKNPPEVRSLTLQPSNRSGERLLLTAYPGGVAREYVLYREEEEFPAELVAGRWERLGQEIGSLKRQMIVAALVDSAGDQAPEGRLFCFLPTTVKLPLPVFLQVDGHTKADRERLHDPKYNHWNRYLLKFLPGFLLRAVLAWRKRPVVAEKLIYYIPESQGSDQLAPVFEELISLLKTASWVRTFDGGREGWTSPEKSIIATRFWTRWVKDYPKFRKQVENLLGKKFVHPDWAANQAWVEKMKYYEIREIGEAELLTILELAKMPNEMLEKDENLIGLYKQILNLPTLKEKEAKQQSRWRSSYILEDVNFNRVKKRLLRASIFPFKGGKFGPLEVEGMPAKIFWLSGKSRRHAGLEGTIDYRIVDGKYTYEPKLDADASPEKRAEIGKVRSRNETVRKLLNQLEIKELSDENLFSELQLPWLLKDSQEKAFFYDQRFKVLGSIFDAYWAKRVKDDDYIKQLAKMSAVYFPAESGGHFRLKEMVLPESLRTHPIDRLYGKSGQEVLRLPAEMLEPALSKVSRVNSHEVKRKKYIEEWRQFLILCGIRNGPELSPCQSEYYSPMYFEEKNEYYFNLWQDETGANFTKSRSVELITVELDFGTRRLLKDAQVDRRLLSEELYQEWMRKFSKESQHVMGFNNWNDLSDPPAGYFVVKYVHKRRLSSCVKDPLWGGIEKELIPIKTARGEIVDANAALRAPLSKQARLKVAAKYLPLALEDEKNEAGYNTSFLDSLEIRRPKIIDVNLLWSDIQEKDFSDVLLAAVELLEIGISGAGLEIYDRESGSLRPATDFRLGRKGTQGVPLIEKQYGKLGRKLGELLGLPEENEVSSFLGFFENIMLPAYRQDDLSGELYRLLKYWQDWDTRSRGVIAADLQATLDKHNTASPPVVVLNDPEILSSLKKACVLALGLKIDDSERYVLERSARELGLILPEDAGDLEVTSEEPLDKQELIRFDRLLREYVASLEDHEKSRLAAQAAGWGLGNHEIWSKRVFRASSLERVIGPAGEVRISLAFPYLDSHRRLFFVEPADIPEIILARLLSMCGFTRFKHACLDIKEIARKIKDTTPSREQAGNVLSGQTQSEIAVGRAIIDADTGARAAVVPGLATKMDESEMIATEAGPDAVREAGAFVSGAGDEVNTVTAGDGVNSPGRRIAVVSGRGPGIKETFAVAGIGGTAGIITGAGSDGSIGPSSTDAGTEIAGAEDSNLEKGGINIYDVARAVREGLLDRRAVLTAEYDDKGWKSGLDPEQEEELRERIGSRLIESINEGPEFYERKSRAGTGRPAKAGVGEYLKVVDPDAGDPRAFLLAEYGGRCQVCATEISLCNGHKWFEVFRICESRGTAWWADRPLNILSMCPNCHALSKHGGRDMINIYITAREVLQGNIFSVELTQYQGDFYLVTVSINGQSRELAISKRHMSYFAGLFKAEAEVAAT